MNSFAGPLRLARSELIPLVPEIAPALPEDPLAIRQRLFGILDGHGVDPEAIPEIAINKTERHIIAGYFIGEQRNLLVTGEGRGATFRDFSVSSIARVVGIRRLSFRGDLQHTIEAGATKLENRFFLDDPGGGILVNADDRYRELGDRASLLTKRQDRHRLAPFINHRGVIPGEGRTLYLALRTKALSSTIPHYLRFIRKHVVGRQERVEAAHDLTQVLTGWSSIHFEEFRKIRSGPRALNIVVSQTAAGTYVASRRGEDKKRPKVYPRIHQGDLHGPTLKCPAHAEADDRDTNLEYLIHAAINAAGNYGQL